MAINKMRCTSHTIELISFKTYGAVGLAAHQKVVPSNSNQQGATEDDLDDDVIFEPEESRGDD